MMKTNIANEDYTNMVHETSKRRITLAGYRLANFVIDIYNQNKTTEEFFKNAIDLETTFMKHAEQN